MHTVWDAAEATSRALTRLSDWLIYGQDKSTFTTPSVVSRSYKTQGNGSCHGAVRRSAACRTNHTESITVTLQLPSGTAGGVADVISGRKGGWGFFGRWRPRSGCGWSDGGWGWGSGWAARLGGRCGAATGEGTGCWLRGCVWGERHGPLLQARGSAGRRF